MPDKRYWVFAQEECHEPEILLGRYALLQEAKARAAVTQLRSPKEHKYEAAIIYDVQKGLASSIWYGYPVQPTGVWSAWESVDEKVT